MNSPFLLIFGHVFFKTRLYCILTLGFVLRIPRVTGQAGPTTSQTGSCRTGTFVSVLPPPSIEVFNEDWGVFPGDTFVNFSKFVGHSSPIIAFFLWLYLLGPAESTLLDSSTQVYAWKMIFINLHCRNNPIVLHLWMIVFVYTKNIAILSSMREGIKKFTISMPFQLIHWWNCVRKFNLPKPC